MCIVRSTRPAEDANNRAAPTSGLDLAPSSRSPMNLPSLGLRSTNGTLTARGSSSLLSILFFSVGDD